MHRIAPCAPYLPRRASDTNKYDYGRVLIVGGCIGYTGAPTLCARAALRCGAGLVSVGVPEAIYAVTAVKNDEAMPFPLPSAEGKLARDALPVLLERFEKKLYDLELTRNISLQMGPQIRLLQNNNTMMAEKIQSTIVNTIPLWKNQMVLALGLAHSQQAMQAERAVTDMTNDLLKKNADALKMGTIETAKESQRGVVDIETLQQTNKSLIDTRDELNKIQSEGRAKRAAAEQELNRIEDELKAKMMEIRS